MSGESLKFDNIYYYYATALHLYIHALMFSRGVGVGGVGGQRGTRPPPPPSSTIYSVLVYMAIRLLKTQICVA